METCMRISHIPNPRATVRPHTAHLSMHQKDSKVHPRDTWVTVLIAALLKTRAVTSNEVETAHMFITK